MKRFFFGCFILLLYIPTFGSNNCISNGYTYLSYESYLYAYVGQSPPEDAQCFPLSYWNDVDQISCSTTVNGLSSFKVVIRSLFERI